MLDFSIEIWELYDVKSTMYYVFEKGLENVIWFAGECQKVDRHG